MDSYCTRCGAALDEDAAYCGRCGKALHPNPPRPRPRRAPIEPSVAWVLLLFFGFQGIHRFYLGGRHVGWGLAYLLTGAFCGIGWIVDLCCLAAWIDERNSEA